MASENKEYEETYKLWSNEELQDSNELIRLARKLTKLRPNEPAAWDALASSLSGLFSFLPEKEESRELSKHEKEKLAKDPLFYEMIDAWGKYLELEPTDQNIIYNRASWFEDVGFLDRAAEEYLNAAQVSKKFPSELEEVTPGCSLYSAARCFFQLERYSKAITALRKAVNEEDCKGDSWNLLAKSLEQTKDIREALEAYKKAAELDPEEYQEDWELARDRLNKRKEK